MMKFAPGFDNMPNISHGFFGARGGVSTGIYDSLNTGHGSDDNPDHITENRARVAAAIGTSEDRLLSCHQCHSTDVLIASEPWEQDERPKADAIVTATPGIACSALAADCAPILFADPVANIIGAAHAGWRGALAGISDKTIEAMESLGAKRDNICAAVGPCIGPQHFEVGPEFIDQFLSESKASQSLFRPGKNDRSYFDMKTYLVRKLLSAGIHAASALPDCTYAQSGEYFSYRRNNHNGVSDYGRNISVIMLNE